jgi:DNA-binding transcriptional MerR regulator
MAGANLEKSYSAFRTISEVAAELAVPKHVLRFWEGKFPQLRPMKRGGGRRYYRPEDVDLLRGIRWLLYSDGYTIKGVQRILRDIGVRFVKECWRGEAKQPDKKPPEAPLPIPDLAGDAAKEARRGRSGGARQMRAPADVQGVEPPRKEDVAASGGQRALLASVLTELEECRDMLRAAAKPGEPSTAKKPRGEHRRGLQA